MVLAACAPLLRAAEPTSVELPHVEVRSTLPLPGVGVPLGAIPSNVQSAGNRDLELRQSRDLSELLERAFDSVHVNAAQGNPFQPDLNFRGFTASPLLGTPQGLSVFVDGARVNEAFGDIVNWDLIPRSAISRVSLLPASSPVFGLNALGGALAIETKSGLDYPGTVLRASAGSFGRRAGEIQHGGSRGAVDYFVLVNRDSEDGWRKHSESDIRQLFGKTRLTGDRTSAAVSLTLADNTLNGTQALPLSMLGHRREAYTWPDRTRNELAFAQAKASHALGASVVVDASIYYRARKTEGFFSNVNDDFDPAVPIGAANSPGFNNRHTIDQRGEGITLQMSHADKLAGRDHQLSIGASFDTAGTQFSDEQQPAAFSADRGTIALGSFNPETSIRTRNRYAGLYFSDTLALTAALQLTLSGRYDHARIAIEDRSGSMPALNGSHRFARFKPGLGLTYRVAGQTSAYASYGRGMRAPTPAELTCADPAAPCRLPNAFIADPPLKPVRAETIEVGLRSGGSGPYAWRAGLYRADVDDDLQFVTASSAANTGFFQNVGAARRQGLELAGAARAAAWSLSASYAYIDATYRSAFSLRSPNNSSAFDTDGDGIPDTITVRPGNRIPGIPRHLLKLRAEYRPDARATWGASLVAASNQYARGDDNNADQGGAVPGYGVVHLDARYAVQRGWQIVVKLDNLFDRRYETLGVLGTNFFRGPGNTFDAASAAREQFRGVAAPRALWVGIEYRSAAAEK